MPRPLPPVALPAVVDAVSERWWGLPPRVRALAVALATVAALALLGRGATRSPWGPPTDVLVAVDDLPGGAPVTADLLRPARWPADLVPHDAVTSADLGPDVRLRGAVVAGAPVTRRQLAVGLGGMVAEGHAAVAVPVDGLPHVDAGDAVDVVATGLDGVGRRVATAARVLAVDDAFLWLDVPTHEVDAVAAAGAAGRLTLAVRPVTTPPGTR